MESPPEENQSNLEQINEENCKTRPIKLPPEMFDKIIENLDLCSFLRLKETCKAAWAKCENVAKGPYLEVDEVHYKDGRIMFITVKRPNDDGEYHTGARSGDWFKNQILQMRCETLQCHMQGDIFKHDESPRKFYDADVTRALKYLNRWNLKAKRLSISNLSCSPRLFEKLIKKFQISEMECYEVANELIASPLWKEMDAIITQSVFPDEGILLQSRFKELRIRFKKLDLKTIGTILQELKEGVRSLEDWHILDVPRSHEEFQELCDNLKNKQDQAILEKTAGNTYKMQASTDQKYTVTLTAAKTLLIVKDE